MVAPLVAGFCGLFLRSVGRFVVGHMARQHLSRPPVSIPKQILDGDVISVDIRTNLEEVLAWVQDYADQLPFATALALTKTGQAIREDLRDELRRSLVAPRPFTLNSPFSTSAKKSHLVATIGIKDQGNGKVPPAKYMAPLFAGGPRRLKAGERALAALGFLPPGWQVVPGLGINLDSHGNIPGRMMRQILDGLRSGASTQSRGRGKKGAASIGYFAVLPGRMTSKTAHLAPGIWRRIKRGSDRAVAPVLIALSVMAPPRQSDS